MNKLPDRAKMRREYLRKKADASAQKVFGYVLVFVFSLLTLSSIVCLIDFFVLDMLDGRTGSANNGWELASIVGLLAFGAVANNGNRILCKAEDMERSITYVPPVHEQLPTLPAEEVLLRGSQASPAAPEELLRPAESEGTKAEELLRPSLGD